MTYTHFGKQADVLKHLLLCELLRIEKAAGLRRNQCCLRAIRLGKNARTGVRHLPLSEESRSRRKECIPERTEYYHPKGALRRSAYYQQESDAMQANRYIGSPGLAMNILGDTARYIFFDIESAPLENVSQYAGTKGLKECITLFNRDSIEGTLELLSSSPHRRSSTSILTR